LEKRGSRNDMLSAYMWKEKTRRKEEESKEIEER